MRTKSTKPRKQRYYAYNVSKSESHKLLSAPLSEKLRKDKGFRSLPLRKGDTVRIVRGGQKGKSGKIIRTDPQNQRVYIDGLVNKKTDASEIPIPIHPSNVIIEKYVERDRRRMLLINRRIMDDTKKIDIEARMEEIKAEEQDLIEIDEEDEFDEDIELLDEDIEDDEFELIDEDEDFEEEDEMADDIDEEEEDQ